MRFRYSVIIIFVENMITDPEENLTIEPEKSIKSLSILFSLLYILFVLGSLDLLRGWIADIRLGFYYKGNIIGILRIINHSIPVILLPIGIYGFFKVKKYGWAICTFAIINLIILFVFAEFITKMDIRFQLLDVLLGAFFAIIFIFLSKKMLVNTFKISSVFQLATVLFSILTGIIYGFYNYMHFT